MLIQFSWWFDGARSAEGDFRPVTIRFKRVGYLLVVPSVSKAVLELFTVQRLIVLFRCLGTCTSTFGFGCGGESAG